MKRSRIVLVVATLIFVASFFATAVSITSNLLAGSGIPGYLCAETAIIFPWSDDGIKLLHEHHLQYIAMLLSGWINLIFLIAVVLLFRKRARRLVNAFRIVLLLMLPACWIIFSSESLRPRYGYFLWIAAMMMALFSNSFENQTVEPETQTPVQYPPSATGRPLKGLG